MSIITAIQSETNDNYPMNEPQIREIIMQAYLKSRKRTTDDFINLMKEVNPNIEILGEYIRSDQKTLVRCKSCGHEWPAPPSRLLLGSGCPVCSGNYMIGTPKVRVYDLANL